MHTWQTHFERIERQRVALLAQLQGKDEARLGAQPRTQAWSARQVIEHLIAAERGSLRYLQHKLKQNEPLPAPDPSAAWRTGLLLISLWQPVLRFAAPPPVAQPANNRPLAELAADWAQLRQDLRELLEQLPPDWHTRPSYRHPRAGRISLVGMLRFFEAHVARHRLQVMRTLA